MSKTSPSAIITDEEIYRCSKFSKQRNINRQKKNSYMAWGLLSLPKFDATIAARKPKMHANGRAITIAPEPNLPTCHQPDQASSICEVHMKS
jgi:hypothetical protein